MKKSKTLSQVGEFGWLGTLLPKLYWPKEGNSRLYIGPGDDAGALWMGREKTLVATTDAMVEGVHFERAWFPWEDLGYKALAVNLSDLAAMGKVRPLAALVTASLPGKTPVTTVNNFYRGLERCAREWKVGLLGGDTTGSTGPWTISIALFGEARPKNLIRRSGARAGDLIATSGPMGLASAGLEILQKRVPQKPWMQPLLKAFLHPRPRFDVGNFLGEMTLATSLTDSSDGLEASVQLLADASHLSATLRLVDLPVAPALARWAKDRHKDSAEYILRGGEDYELVFTCTPLSWPKILRKFPEARVIGQMNRGTKRHRLVTPIGETPLQSYGFSQF